LDEIQGTKVDRCSKTWSEGDVQQIVKNYDKAPAKPVKYEINRRSPQMYDNLPLRMVRYPTTHVER